MDGNVIDVGACGANLGRNHHGFRSDVQISQIARRKRCDFDRVSPCAAIDRNRKSRAVAEAIFKLQGNGVVAAAG